MYTFTKLQDRRIPKVRVGVGVGPMEFQLNNLRDDAAVVIGVARVSSPPRSCYLHLALYYLETMR